MVYQIYDIIVSKSPQNWLWKFLMFMKLEKIQLEWFNIKLFKNLTLSQFLQLTTVKIYSKIKKKLARRYDESNNYK